MLSVSRHFGPPDRRVARMERSATREFVVAAGLESLVSPRLLAVMLAIATVCCLICRPALSQAPTTDLYSFGNWIIVQINTNNSYQLIGGSTGKAPGHFYLQCGEDNFYAIGIPLFKTSKNNSGKVVVVTVWSADGQSRDISLLAVNYALATEISYKDKVSPAVRDFVEILSNAQKFFAMSFMGDTYEFDLTHFPAAKNKFDQLCERLSPH